MSDLQRVVCRRGRLVYADGAEVALWGSNYYAAHFCQYDNIKSLGLDHKAVIDRDLDDLKAIGCEVVRMHLFDREITDRQGRLVENPHLDLVCYTIAACARRGIYFFLTPVAWWPAAQFDSADGFSNAFSQEALKFLPAALDAQETYLRELLAYPNPYRAGLPIGRDPAIALIEIMNECEFSTYENTVGIASGAIPEPRYEYGGPATHGSRAEKTEILRQFAVWRQARTRPDDREAYLDFICDTHTAYSERMAAAIRALSPDASVFMPYFCNWYVPNIAASLARSSLDGVTFNLYLCGEGWKASQTVAGMCDMLARVDYAPLTETLRHKAKAVYEWDDLSTRRSVIPLMARRFREAGAQVAAHFQYDSFATASTNADWPGHWMNRDHSPGRGVAYAIGREVMHATPLYADPGPCADHPGPPPILWRWGDTRPRKAYTRSPIEWGALAVDPDADCAVWSTDDIYLHSHTVPASLRVRAPARAPRSVLGVGDDPWYETDADGWFRVEQDGDGMRVELGPRVTVLAPPQGTGVFKDATSAAPVTRLEPGPRSLSIRKSD